MIKRLLKGRFNGSFCDLYASFLIPNHPPRGALNSKQSMLLLFIQNGNFILADNYIIYYTENAHVWLCLLEMEESMHLKTFKNEHKKGQKVYINSSKILGFLKEKISTVHLFFSIFLKIHNIFFLKLEST